MAKKLKKYQNVGQVNSGPGGISDADLKKMLEDLKKKPRTGSDMDPGFRPDIKRGPNYVPPVKLRGIDETKPSSGPEPVRLRGKDENPSWVNRPTTPKPNVDDWKYRPSKNDNTSRPFKKGGTITALDQVQRMYSKKK